MARPVRIEFEWAFALGAVLFYVGLRRLAAIKKGKR